MQDSKILVVVGATGAQGGGLARAILADPDGGFRCRALTRNPDSDAARALADAGAEVVRADLDDLDSLTAAFEGAYGAFCVTNFWEHFSPDKEKAQAETLAHAAQTAGLQHVVWSTLEDTRDWVPTSDDRMPTLMGVYTVPHFDAKAEADAFFRDRGVPTTFLRTSFYWDNFITFGAGPQRTPDGGLALVYPMGDEKLAGIAAEDIGKTAYGIFQAGDRYIGQTVSIAGDHTPIAAMAATLSDALGQDIAYIDVSPDVYRSFPFDGADEMGNMYQVYRDFAGPFLAARDLDATRALNPDLQDFPTWVARNKDRIPIPPAG